MSERKETVADIIAKMRNRTGDMYDGLITMHEDEFHSYADRLEEATERERHLLKSCARWIFTHDIYGHMSRELLAECKELLHDDGQFLFQNEGE